VWQIALDDRAAIPWPDQITFETDRVLGAWFSPAPSDTRLIFARDTGGNENAQLFLVSANGVVTPLTAGYEQAMHMFGVWSADGGRILFSANRRDPALFDLYLQPLEGEARLIWQNDTAGFLFKMVFSPDEQRVAVMRLQARSIKRYSEVDPPLALRQITRRTEQRVTKPSPTRPTGSRCLVNTDFNRTSCTWHRSIWTRCRSKPLSRGSTIWNG
jgi:hypothetical protein